MLPCLTQQLAVPLQQHAVLARGRKPTLRAVPLLTPAPARCRAPPARADRAHRTSIIFCEAVAIYGVIVAIILQTKVEAVPAGGLLSQPNMAAGYAIFGAGLTCGFSNLVCG